MDKGLVIRITVVNKETGRVYEEFVRVTETQYGREIEGVFEGLGKVMAKIVDPHHDD